MIKLLKNRITKRLAVLAIVGAALGGIATTAQTATPVAPTQSASAAFGPIAYWSQCPAQGQWQTLRIENYSGADVNYATYRNGTGTLLGTGSVPNFQTRYITVPTWSATYRFWGSGTLNWFYSTQCY